MSADLEYVPWVRVLGRTKKVVWKYKKRRLKREVHNGYEIAASEAVYTEYFHKPADRRWDKDEACLKGLDSCGRTVFFRHQLSVEEELTDG